MSKPWVIQSDGDLILTVLLQPKASRTQVQGLHDNALKIAITTPPIDGKANAFLMKYLSKQLAVPKSSISIISGQLQRRKRLLIAAGFKLPAHWQALI